MSSMEYTAQVGSRLVNGEAKLTIGENSFTASSALDIAEIPYAYINEITYKNYIVTVLTDDGIYSFSRMGEWGERFYDSLCEAYNKAVLKSMFVSGKPLVTAAGDYRYSESGASGSGTVPVYVYDKCVVALPPNINARRVPLCFVNAIEKGSYTLTLRLETGESYTFSKLGYETDPIEAAVEKQKRALLEKAMQAVKEIDPGVSATEASQLAKLLQEGAAAELKQLGDISQSFVTALEGKIAQTRAAEYYQTLKETCDPSKIYIGFRKGDGAAGKQMYWIIAPSPNGSNATVEFSEADTATFVYKTRGSFKTFAGQLNRALEAINFKREVIFISDEELKKPEYAHYYMAAKRTAALQFVRANFTGRVVHSNPEAWKKRLTDVWSGAPGD